MRIIGGPALDRPSFHGIGDLVGLSERYLFAFFHPHLKGLEGLFGNMLLHRRDAEGVFAEVTRDLLETF